MITTQAAIVEAPKKNGGAGGMPGGGMGGMGDMDF
jgi:chaperonin GroEL